MEKTAEMGKRVALVGIIVENMASIERLNAILHEYNEIIVGRMGIPYRDRRIGIISVVVDALNDEISALTGKLGKLDGVSVIAVYSKIGAAVE